KTVGIRLNFWIHLNVPCAGRPIDASGTAMSWLLRLLSSENQIPDAMPQAQATGFKFGLRTKVGAWGIAVWRRIGKAGFGAKHFQHWLGIVCRAGSAVYVAARRNAAGQQRNECGLNQAALVMALLGPGVGEVKMHAGQR